MAREFFCAYHSYLKSIEPLTDAEKGRLFVSCLQYSMTGEAPDLRGNERFIFPMMKEQIDRDNANYQAKCERNRENILRRYTNVDGGIRQPTKSTKEKKKENNTPPKSPQGDAADELFDRFWSAYPRHVAKEKTRTSFSKVPLLEIPNLMSALERQKKSDQWTKDGGQFIPHPTTWLNQRRWQDEITVEITQPQKQPVTSVKAPIDQEWLERYRKEHPNAFTTID